MKGKSVDVKAYCKINIALDIKGIRDNGYHEVEMIMQTVPLYDVVKICPMFLTGENRRVELASDADWVPLSEKNTAYKAAQMLTEDFSQIETGTKIYIEKKIPGCGGLGGSSADAAAVLLGMNELYELGLSLEDLQSYGVKIGADVPFLLKNGAALATGYGTDLQYIEPIREGLLLLVNAGIEVSTPEAYKLYDVLEKKGKIPTNAHPDVLVLADAMKSGVKALSGQMKNVLEYPAFYLQPQISELKDEVYKTGAEIAMMSGSGGTVFGIFLEDNDRAAERAQEYFAQKGFFTFLCRMGEIDSI